MSDRVEVQAEVDARRADVFPLLATPDGLARWMDEVELEASVGGRARFRLRDGIAVGEVLSLQPPQHISFTWDWEGRSLGRTSVVAFDAIDHGKRTHVTFRHVGLPNPNQVNLHDELWRYWMKRFVEAAEGTARSG